MKRSQINEIIAASDSFIRGHGYVLPPFAYWTPDEVRAHKDTAVVRRGLGWDVTDYGKGAFDEMGLFLFTARNGDPADLARGKGMLYAEKIMISRAKQLAPMHKHNIKAEDIINRGGGTLALELFASAPDGTIDREAAVTVPVDGVMRTLPAGGRIALTQGESVTLLPGVWHAFWGEGGDVLVVEVSTVNDDRTDNVFDPEVPRFTTIDEDAAPDRLLVSDYPNL